MNETLFYVDAPIPARAPIGEHRKTAPPLAGRMAAQVRADAPDTSWEAAASITPQAASALELLILSTFQRFGPMTDEELCNRLDQRHPPTVVSARTRLYKREALTGAGTKRNSRNRMMTVWALASSQSEVA